MQNGQSAHRAPQSSTRGINCGDCASGESLSVFRLHLRFRFEGLLRVLKAVYALQANVQSHQQDQCARHIRCLVRDCAEPAPSLGGVFEAEGGQRPRRDHRQSDQTSEKACSK
jgi:hypothetical protein